MRAVTVMGLSLWTVGALLAGSIASAPAQQSSPQLSSTRTAPSPQEAPITNCDAYAASDLDPQRKANGIPFDKINSVLAIPACESAVQKYPNSVRLIYQLGRAYARANNFGSAVMQYQKAADRGYVPSEYDLGVLYEKGLGVVPDEAQAVAWYRRAAEQGFALAQSNLGNIYRNGLGVPQDYAEALKWLHEAADQGNADTLVMLGTMYAAGQGVQQNFSEAVKFYRTAAKQGDAHGQSSLGSMYGLGQGVPQDYAEAAKWLRLAANQGYANAQYLLGLMYENGDGVPINLAEAANWYRKAAAQGDDDAQRRLVPLDADAKAGRAAEEAGNSTLRRELAAGKTTSQAWEDAALAAGRAVLDVELAAGQTQEAATHAAQQAADQVRARAPKVGAGTTGTIVRH
jgi:TPR repeat protein